MIKFLRGAWSWSWVVTVPASIVFLYWVDQTFRSYLDFGLRYDPYPENFSLRATGDRQARVMLNTAAYELSASSGYDAATQFPYVSLFVGEAELARLDRNLPHSGFQEVKGQILSGDEFLRCDVRYRGDNAFHWALPKKSWRVKMKKDRLWGGMRRFNLIAPKGPAQVNNFIGYKLAEKMGLLAPRVEFVQLVINGRLRGVHLLVEQLDESTLRRSGVMPGDLYSGELIGRDLYRDAAPRQLFEHPEIWEKVAVNNHYVEESIEPLARLARLVAGPPSEEVGAELAKLLDFELWGRFSVFETVTQCFHFDETHNWRLYWDSNRGSFVPIVWDAIAYNRGWSPKALGQTKLDVIASRFQEHLYRNGAFLRARQLAFAEFFAAGHDKWLDNKLTNLEKPLLSALGQDAHRKGGTLLVIGQFAADLVASMNIAFADLRAEYFGRRGRLLHTPIDEGLALTVSGRRPVNRLSLVFDSNPVELPSVAVRYTVDGRRFERDVSGASSLSGTELTVDLGLLPEHLSTLRWNHTPLTNHQKTIVPAYYELLVSGWADGYRIDEVRCDRGSGWETTESVDQIRPKDIRGMYSLVDARPITVPRTIKGRLVVEATEDVHGDVFIEPGTTIELAPGASIRFWGRVMAEGTAEQPIRFVPQSAEQEPWGVIALQGDGTEGSRFTHCTFFGGSGWKEDMVEYSAMFSVHDTRDVEVRSCRFSDSKIVDDMVHTVYAHISFYDCEFQGALLDALDMDISEGAVVNCDFRDSGNDSLDLMSSRIVVDGSNMIGAGDKGISVGEGTTLLCTNSRFLRCNIGIEAKDSSRAFIYNSLFEGNTAHALNAYKKNWRYDGGGHVFVRKSTFIESVGGINADKYASIQIDDCFLDRMPAFDQKRVTHTNSDSTRKVVPRVSVKEPLPLPLQEFVGLTGRYFAGVDFKRRGPLDGER